MYLDQVDELEAYLKINSKMKNLITLLIIPSLLFFMISNCEGTNNIIRKWRILQHILIDFLHIQTQTQHLLIIETIA